MKRAPWLVSFGGGAPEVRLLCLPHAGGGTISFRPWALRLGPRVELLAARLPGRETRLREAPLRSVDAIVEAVAASLDPPDDLPLVLFGHSFGALLAHALARRLECVESRPVAALLVSGRGAPHLPGRAPALAHLSRREVVLRIAELYGGIPQVLLDDPGYVATLGIALQADLEALERHACSSVDPLNCPIAAYGGTTDPLIRRHDLDAWSQHTRAAFEADQFEGDHFYLNTPKGSNALLAEIQKWCSRVASLNESAL